MTLSSQCPGMHAGCHTEGRRRSRLERQITTGVGSWGRGSTTMTYRDPEINDRSGRRRTFMDRSYDGYWAMPLFLARSSRWLS
jgi:hypothetical protein